MKATLNYQKIEDFMYQNTSMKHKGNFKIMSVYQTDDYSLLQIKEKIDLNRH